MHPACRSFVSATGLAGALLFAVLFAASVPAADQPRQDSGRRIFNVPADTAERSLKVFSQQSGRGVIAAAHDLGGVRINAVKGELTAAEALTRMLSGTGLVATEDAATGAYAIRRNIDEPSGNRSARPTAHCGAGLAGAKQFHWLAQSAMEEP
jgi:iron complex outermembrane recepter protein